MSWISTNIHLLSVNGIQTFHAAICSFRLSETKVDKNSKLLSLVGYKEWCVNVNGLYVDACVSFLLILF